MSTRRETIRGWVRLDVPDSALDAGVDGPTDEDGQLSPTERRWLTDDGLYVAVAAYGAGELSEGARGGVELHHGLVLGGYRIPDEADHNVIRIEVEGASTSVASLGPILASAGALLSLLLIVAHTDDGRAVVAAFCWPYESSPDYFTRAVELGRTLRIQPSPTPSTAGTSAVTPP